MDKTILDKYQSQITITMKREREKRSGLAIIKSNTREYCNSTTLHGFSYWVNNTDTKAEKIFWVLVVILGFAMASVIIAAAFKGRDSCLL